MLLPPSTPTSGIKRRSRGFVVVAALLAVVGRSMRSDTSSRNRANTMRIKSEGSRVARWATSQVVVQASTPICNAVFRATGCRWL